MLAAQEEDAAMTQEEDFIIELAPRRPLIPAGEYDARSGTVIKYRMYDRDRLQIGFTVFDGPYSDGVVLTTVDGHFGLGGGKRAALGASSRVAQIARLIDPDGQNISTAQLRNRLWRVKVETVTTDQHGRPLAEDRQYSKVSDVIALLE
jgi:hypothetical protein